MTNSTTSPGPSTWAESDRHEAISYARRLREENLAGIRMLMRTGNVKKANELIAATRKLEEAMCWDGTPIDEEDFLGKHHINTRTENKPMTTQDKKLEILTEMAKLPPAELAKLRVLAEHIGEFSKLSPQQRAVVLAKAERAGALVLAKSASSNRGTSR